MSTRPACGRGTGACSTTAGALPGAQAPGTRTRTPSGWCRWAGAHSCLVELGAVQGADLVVVHVSQRGLQIDEPLGSVLLRQILAHHGRHELPTDAEPGREQPLAL